ncbi:MAG: helix-turn-helix domain-containing protein [Methylococcales bacterium]|nr:helix-turn-helix domain-containing protein [Methylococcales bacterium]
MTESIDKPEPILLKKWQMINAALYDKNLSKSDVAIQYQILDRYSVINGSCWPSFKRLASDTGLSQRMVQKSVKKLTTMGYVAIVKHGDRVSSNHYRPDFSLLDRVENHSSLPNDEVENASSVCREPQFLKVENPSSLKPINEPEHKARGELVGLEDKPSSAASLATPLGGLPLASEVKDKYSDFWEVYPMRKHVSKAEDEITAMLSNGVLLADIVEGARLYAEHIKVKQATWKGGKDYTIQPQNFIAKERWRDDWTITPKPEVKPKVVIDEKIVIDVPTDEDFERMWNDFTEHCDKCPSCLGYSAWDEFKPVKDKFLFDFCDNGKSMYYEYWFYNAKTRKLKVKKESNKNELIESYYQYQKSTFLCEDNEDADIRMDKAELNSFHLFK